VSASVANFRDRDYYKRAMPRGTPRRKSAVVAQAAATTQIRMMARWGTSADDDDEFIEQAEKSRVAARGNKPMQTFLSTVLKPVRAVKDGPAPGDRPLRCLTRSKKDPANRQAEIARHLLWNRAAIAVHGVGTGKTLLAVLAAECALLNVSSVRKVVVIAPLSLVPNFYEALREYAPALEEAYKVITYQDFERCYQDELVDAKSKLLKDLKPLHARLRADFGDAVLVIDEAHNLRTEVTAKPGKHLKGKLPYLAVLAGKYARRVLLLSATPVVNEPADLGNLLAIGRGDGVPFSKAEMAAIVSAPSALRKAAGRMLSFFTADRTGALAKEYPRVIEHDMHLFMSREQQRAYERIEAGQLDGVELDSADPKAFYTGLRQAVNLPDIGQKADAVADLVAALPRKEQRVIVYAQFIEFGIKTLQRALDKRGLGHASVVGSMSARAREAAKRSFDAREVEVMLLSAAGGTGLSFEGVRHFFLFEPTWTPAEETQAAGRANRYRSHAALPPADRTLTVHKLRVSKRYPKTAGFDLSADDLLLELSAEKRLEIDAFTRELRKLDIGKTFAALPPGVAAAAPAPARAPDIACEARVRKRRPSGKR